MLAPHLLEIDHDGDFQRCARSIGSISFRHHSTLLFASESRAKGEQSYGSFGACWIIFRIGSVQGLGRGARNGSLTSRLQPLVGGGPGFPKSTDWLHGHATLSRGDAPVTGGAVFLELTKKGLSCPTLGEGSHSRHAFTLDISGVKHEYQISPCSSLRCFSPLLCLRSLIQPRRLLRCPRRDDPVSISLLQEIFVDPIVTSR